ncbi:TetR family transcriptional regulator [Actinorhabdospora filicis]|uniref:TetR family transcriptional regulator n=1 Tax=Actinorhabdospora filicis TaxID=1785913 RepID=A0A9W6W6K3_9ACTN|nr:TetR/AcrR family transcriptional regulator [Actinorhabdospora filicis]GLZ81637.1 TetR family transcriptional regulator [Actinorhabdospora filicis]
MSRAEALLDRCVEYLSRTGFGDQSLRQIAAGVQSSHRMLIYHFGSREGLLAAVVARVEAEQRAALAELSTLDAATGAEAFWHRLADPALAPPERLFFEVYALALHHPDWAAGFRDAVITAWLAPTTAALAERGHTPEEAAARARLALAAVRGLLMDLLLTGDREGVDAAAAAFRRMLFA